MNYVLRNLFGADLERRTGGLRLCRLAVGGWNVWVIQEGVERGLNFFQKVLAFRRILLTHFCLESVTSFISSENAQRSHKQFLLSRFVS